MDSTTWGRAAASRFAKTPEEIQADIIKALEGKLSVEFQNYAQWERVTSPDSASPQLAKTKQTSLKVKSREKSEASRPVTGSTALTSCSSLCLHPWNKKAPPVDRSAEERRRQHVLWLKTQIAAKKKSVETYKKLKRTLMNDNYLMKQKIIEGEKVLYEQVTNCLEKSHKYMGASKILTKEHKLNAEASQKDAIRAKSVIEESEKDLEQQLVALDNKLLSAQKNLQTLRTYKDKEYPVKVMLINKLNTDIENLKIHQKAEAKELEKMIGSESSQLKTGRHAQLFRILEEAAEDAHNSPASHAIHQLRDCNLTLKTEISLHKKEIENLEAEICEMKQKITADKNSDDIHVRRFVFPEVFIGSQKCHPDEDIVLDIPTNVPLPV